MPVDIKNLNLKEKGKYLAQCPWVMNQARCLHVGGQEVAWPRIWLLFCSFRSLFSVSTKTTRPQSQSGHSGVSRRRAGRKLYLDFFVGRSSIGDVGRGDVGGGVGDAVRRMSIGGVGSAMSGGMGRARKPAAMPRVEVVSVVGWIVSETFIGDTGA